MKDKQETKIIKTFHDYGKIEHVFYTVDGLIVRIRAFSYEGLESEVPQFNLHKWGYDASNEICFINKGDD